jgi:hypothetical protein
MATNRRPQYIVLAGIGVLAIVVLLLLASPSSIFSSMVTVIGGDPNKSTTDQVSVITKTDFNDPEKMKLFPYDIGKWHGQDYDAGNMTGILKADIVLIRGYDPETFAQPLFLIVVQGNADSSIHEPHYCFPNIVEQSREDLVVTNPSWSSGRSSITIPLNKLVSAPQNLNGQIKERRLVLYFYVKGNQLYDDSVTLVEIQGLAPLQGSYETTLNEEKEFISQVVPYMFEPGVNSNKWHPIAASMAERGAIGYIGIVVIVLIPVTMIVYPILRRRGKSR